MKSNLDQSFLDRIRGAVPISRLANTTRTRTECPFHSSKDKDLSLNHNNDTWRCFGRCGKGGDIFEWMKMERPEFSFADIVKHLANLGNIPTKPPSKRIEILSKAMADYRGNLRYSSKATKFLLDRGINEETWFKANIGFSMGTPPDISIDDLKSVGLLCSNGDPYFANRIMFAIHDQSCNIIHLQGRTLGLDFRSDVKYIQLPKDTTMGSFPISQYLYGEDQLTRDIDTAFINEGIPDSLIVRQLGFTSFATIGNQGFHIHAYKLKRIKRLYIMMDNDSASQDKVVQELARMQSKLPNTEVYNVTLPKEPGEEKMDTNEWYLKHKPSSEQFMDMVKANAKPAIQLVIDSLSTSINTHYQIAEVLSSTPDPERWVQYFSKKVGWPRVSIDYLLSVVSGNDRSVSSGISWTGR